MRVCRSCFCESRTLDSKFAESKRTDDCPTCGSSSVALLDTDELVEAFAPLHKMYEVAERGQHYLWNPDDDERLLESKCDGLLFLLLDDWKLFSDDIEDSIQRDLLRALWPGWDETSDYSRECWWEEYADSIWERLAHRVKHKRRFFPPATNSPRDNDDIERDLRHYIDACDDLDHAETWIRARPGKRLASEMGAPSPNLVKKGQRANPAGIAYLYLASDEETALAEVRAEPGDEVTLARIVIPKNARIADLSDLHRTEIDPLGHEDLKFEINRRALLRRFAEDLSRPVTDNDHEIDYVPTQYLAEFFLTLGFDGICFRSSLANGKNIVFFDPERSSINPEVFHVRVISKKSIWIAVNAD